MPERKRLQLLVVAVLAGGCAIAAVSVVPRLVAAENADAQARNGASQEIASAAAAALDQDGLRQLPDAVRTLMGRHRTVLAVEVVTQDGVRVVQVGAVDRLLQRLAARSPEIHGTTLVRDGKPWGTVHILFEQSAALGALHPASPIFWVLVGLAVVGLPVVVTLAEALRRRLDRSPSGPMAVAAEGARHTLDTLAEGVLLLDPRGRVMFANTAFCDLAGAPADKLVGTPAAELPWTGFPGGMAAAPWDAAIRAGQPTRGARVGLRRHEHDVVFIANCTPLFHKKHTLHGVLVTLDDVTELEQSRTALQIARDTADQANAAKSRFLAMMSHEIRTPLNGVCGSVQLLKKTGLQDRQTRYADAASFSASTLLHLINDILDFSKIEAGQLELSPVGFEFERCVDDTMLMMVQAASPKGLCLAYEIEPEVCPRFLADPDRIRQIIINLTNNAIKFTERGSVTLRVGVEHDGPGRQTLRCSVTDTGVGIPAAKMDRLFKPFSQVDSSTSRKYGGTGLGLIISKQLCELMGGHIEVASREGEGTTFTFFLDLPKVSAVSPEPASPIVETVVLVGFHALEVNIARRVFSASADRVIACADETQLTAAVAPESELRRGGRVVCILAAPTAVEAARGGGAIRRLFSGANLRIVGASFGPEPSTADEAHGIDGWILRPLGAARLRQVLKGDTKLTTHAGPGAPKPGEVLADLSGLRILLAEDNPVGQMVVSDMLRGAGASCDAANNGNEVLAALDRGRYDLVLMDCFMPELDGFETTRRIRELQREGKLQNIPPIIALTAKAMRGDRESCLEAGMNGYISKPVDERELLRTVAEHTGRSGVRTPKAAPRDRPNLTALRERFGGKSDVFTRLLQAYRDTSAEDLGRIDRALESHDASMLEQAAHRLAGGAGFVSAEEVRRLARELENRAVAQQLDDLAESAHQLRLEVAESIRDLEGITGPRETHHNPATVLGKE